MTRPLVSVVMATYQRGHLLRRSIEGYNRSWFPLGRLEVIVVDDGSTDQTSAVVERFDPMIDLKYLRLRKPPGLWRDCAAVINCGIRAARADTIIITHPEIVPGRESIQSCLDLAQGGGWVSCRGYYLKPADMDHLDAVGLDERGPLAVRSIPGFYDPVPGGAPDYHPLAVERDGLIWQSWIFGGTTRAVWRQWGGVIPTERWGSVDITLMERRRLLGTPTVTPRDPEAIVLHLNHDRPEDLRTERTEYGPGGWRNEVSRLGLNAETCRYPHVDELGW